MKEINREEFKQFILEGKTIPQLQNIYECSRGTIAEHKRLFGFVGLTPNSKRRDPAIGTKYCPRCKLTLELNSFYSNGTHPSGLVKYKPTCIKCENSSRHDKFKNLILEWLTINNRKYECEVCGFSDSFGSLDFHHINPADKNFNIGSYTKSISIDTFVDIIVPELNKCKLVCPNCHRKEHILMGST